VTANTTAATTAAAAPASRNTRRTDIGLPGADGHRGCSRAVVLATACG
jgi:hypothetical protein